jgi:hypothetical protein
MHVAPTRGLTRFRPSANQAIERSQLSSTSGRIYWADLRRARGFSVPASRALATQSAVACVCPLRPAPSLTIIGVTVLLYDRIMQGGGSWEAFTPQAQGQRRRVHNPHSTQMPGAATTSSFHARTVATTYLTASLSPGQAWLRLLSKTTTKDPPHSPRRIDRPTTTTS